jgi:Na+/H+ antiporter NhaD/arsenite permease-like protein
MFFMGILMSVEALNAAGLLGQLARALNDAVPNVDIIAASIGLVSALIDNVPLVSWGRVLSGGLQEICGVLKALVPCLCADVAHHAVTAGS